MTSTRTETELSLRGSLTDEQVAELMADDIPPEYDVDYAKTKPNRFVKREGAVSPQTVASEPSRL